MLVDASSGDDAAVYQLDDGRALVVTADFITPVVDDPETWGRIAAANAVSDVYAMGGRPLLALNLVAWNTELPTSMLGDVMVGAESVALDDGFVIAGGHTVDDPEPKFGLAVVGEVHPDRIITNAGLVAGQTLVLTKPLGIGVVTTAVKAGVCPPEVEAAAVAQMARTNAAAAAVAVAAGVTGGTDVTGFGLLGHLGRAAEESSVGLIIESGAVRVLDGVAELAAAGMVPGGSKRNLEWVGERLRIDAGVSSDTVALLADAQTSGGLVVGVDPSEVDAVVGSLQESGHEVAVIGSVTADQPGTIGITP